MTTSMCFFRLYLKLGQYVHCKAVIVSGVGNFDQGVCISPDSSGIYARYCLVGTNVVGMIIPTGVLPFFARVVSRYLFRMEYVYTE
jgi:hypothetical protein